MKVLPLTIFLGAFLVFQIQPTIARFILPWFGGTPAVWTTSMLFFQFMLLAGYVYTHLLVKYLSTKRQALVHCLLLAVSFLFLPVTPADHWKPDGNEQPMLQILSLLFVTLCLPYLMVSSTAPLIQSWAARVRPDRTPYRLYALSNIGSFLGLLSYPFLIEPLFGLRNQTLIWSALYALFAIVTARSAWTLLHRARHPPGRTEDTGETTPTPGSNRALIVLLSAAGVVVLLAATNQLCRDVAVIPLLWVLPLTLYLVSFVVTFGQPAWYRRSFWSTIMVISIAAVIYVLHQEYAAVEVDLYVQIFIYSAVVFGCCMVCHGELYRLRPPARDLTSFYLYVALGGAAGGVFVNILAPVLFLGYWEFHASLLASTLLLVFCISRDQKLDKQAFLRSDLVLIATPLLICLTVSLGAHIKSQQEESILTRRSFYGILRVYEYDVDTQDHIRSLYHGRIGHGDQFWTQEHRTLPLTYYGPESGLALAIGAQRDYLRAEKARDGLNLGVVGLGTATAAAYADKADRLRFYEINADVLDIAQSHFSYLSDSGGEITIQLGDARISMEAELKNGAANAFDVLAIDAFSGDAIPVHLLTKEALAVYRRHVSPDGMIAIHISNLHFDLRPVAQALAADSNMKFAWIPDDGDDRGEDPNDWILLTTNVEVFDKIQSHAEPSPHDPSMALLWTDDYADVLGALWAD